VIKHAVNPANKRYVGLQENIICFQCGNMGHYRCTCPLRKYAMERSMISVKQIWVRKDEICMSRKMGRKWIWVPKLTPNLFCRLMREGTTQETTNYGMWIVVVQGT